MVNPQGVAGAAVGSHSLWGMGASAFARENSCRKPLFARFIQSLNGSFGLLLGCYSKNQLSSERRKITDTLLTKTGLGGNISGSDGGVRSESA